MSPHKEVLIELQPIAWVTMAEDGFFRVGEALQAAPPWVWSNCM